MHQSIDKKNRIIIYLIFLFILSTVSNKALKDKKNYSISVNKINISGLSKNNNLSLFNRLENFFHKNIFILEKEEINKIILEYNIVEEYNVKKIYPSKLNIEIKPAKFIARTYNNSQLLVGSNGKLIKDKISNEKLPYIFGQFNSAEFLKFKKQIEFSKFNFSDFKNVSFYSSKRWDVLTVDDILIKLPKNKILEAINLAYEIIQNNQFKVSKLIDLRISNHLIIK